MIDRLEPSHHVVLQWLKGYKESFRTTNATIATLWPDVRSIDLATESISTPEHSRQEVTNIFPSCMRFSYSDSAHNSFPHICFPFFRHVMPPFSHFIYFCLNLHSSYSIFEFRAFFSFKSFSCFVEQFFLFVILLFRSIHVFSFLLIWCFLINFLSLI